MCSDIAIRVNGLSKCYEIYADPSDRLKQFIMPRAGRIFGFSCRQYFKEFWALKDVVFDVNKGETVGIIGSNGSGKSTLLQMICGTLSPSRGSIETNGRIAALLELGSGFNPEFTGRENVYMNASVLGLSIEEIDSRYDDIVAFADIGEFIEQPVKTYSSGMVVRLAFAVASSVDPEILIVDEALAVGDSVFQAKCYRRFKQLQEKGATVLLVTHDIGAVIQLCSRAFVLHRGELVASGAPKEMGDEYRRRCAEELGSSCDLVVQSDTFMHGAPLDTAEEVWMDRSPNTEEYGDGRANIVSFALSNSSGRPSTQISSGEEVDLRMKINFNEACLAPIAAFGFHDLSGHDICGSNSWYENHEIGYVEPGETVTVAYRFKLPLQAGVYNLRIACTEIGTEGLLVHHRLLDVAVIEITAARRFTGKFDLQPSVSISRDKG